MLSFEGVRRLPVAACAVICFAAAELAHILIAPGAPAALPSVWAPTGVLAGVLLMTERRGWLSFVAAGAAAMLFSLVAVHGRSAPSGVVIAALSAVDASAAAWLVSRTLDRPFALDRLPHTFTFAVAAVLVPIGGGLIAGALLEAELPLPLVWRAWWLGEAIGLIGAAPLVAAALGAPPGTFRSLRSWRALEMVLAMTLGTVVAVAIFSGWLHPLLRVPAYTLPFLLWPIFRFGPGGGAAALFMLTCIAAWYASHGRLPFVVLGESNLVIRMQGAIIVANASLLLLASVIADRKRVADERDALLAERQAALAEIKALRGFIPICAWCRKVRDDEGFWQELENYIDANTDATFSHGICPSCTEHERRAIDAHVAARR
jgi:integral membrane sensor domain MASE1